MSENPVTPAAFESKVTRDKSGAILVTMRSPILEDVFAPMTGGRTTDQGFRDGAVALHDPVTGLVGAFNRRAKCYYSDATRFAADSCKMYWHEQPLYDNAPSITSLCVVGLRHGITWQIHQPMTIDMLKAYNARLKSGIKAILDSVRPVEMTLSVPMVKKTAGAEVANAG